LGSNEVFAFFLKTSPFQDLPFSRPPPFKTSLDKGRAQLAIISVPAVLHHCGRTVADEFSLTAANGRKRQQRDAHIERHQPDPGNEVGRWARQFLPPGGSIGTFELLTRLSQGINHGFRYRRREAKGIQQPVETLRLGHGSCRDFALLMIEAARSLGLAARFASGYLAVPLDDPEQPTSGSARGSTHAWAQIYLPGTGWIDFDPTSGSVGKIGLVTVAVVRDPHHATPLHGTFIGFPSDHLGMEVQVSVTSGTQEAKHSLDRASELEPRFRRARVRRSRSAGSGAGAAAAMAASNR
jgi:hypothetical protein